MNIRTRLSPRLFHYVGVTALVAGCAMMAPAPARTEGGMLVNTASMTLYTFDNDASSSGKSVCNGPCATNWPPLMATASDSGRGDWTIVTRDDGGKQWAYRGKPLYLWIKDQKPGDTSGDNVNKVWHIAHP